ncbi:MAG: hypothetical protein ACJAZN_002732, partial [Planctomycetota bacterium]
SVEGSAGLPVLHAVMPRLTSRSIEFRSQVRIVVTIESRRE